MKTYLVCLKIECSDSYSSPDEWGIYTGKAMWDSYKELARCSSIMQHDNNNSISLVKYMEIKDETL